MKGARPREQGLKGTLLELVTIRKASRGTGEVEAIVRRRNKVEVASNHHAGGWGHGVLEQTKCSTASRRRSRVQIKAKKLESLPRRADALQDNKTTGDAFPQ